MLVTNVDFVLAHFEYKESFGTVTYFHSDLIINAFVLSDVLSDVRVT